MNKYIPFNSYSKIISTNKNKSTYELDNLLLKSALFSKITTICSEPWQTNMFFDYFSYIFWFEKNPYIRPKAQIPVNFPAKALLFRSTDLETFVFPKSFSFIHEIFLSYIKTKFLKCIFFNETFHRKRKFTMIVIMKRNLEKIKLLIKMAKVCLFSTYQLKVYMDTEFTFSFSFTVFIKRFLNFCKSILIK